MQLVIVESPTKVKTIGKYLGKEYKVLSSKGHIRDLPKSKLGIDVEHDFAPDYQVMVGKEAVVKELIKEAKNADTIVLATDLDREGEAISWHVKELLTQNGKSSTAKTSKSKQKSNKLFQRVIFHEITKSAIEEAFKHPREINNDLVDAYQARRVLDRIVGYKLSPLLWSKIRFGLSAGRVQSVVVRLVVERERERESFKSVPYYHFWAHLKNKNNEPVNAELSVYKKETIEIQNKMKLFVGQYTFSETIFKDKQKVDDLAKNFHDHYFEIGSIQDKEVTRHARPPFTTARLQQSAVNQFGFTSKRAMSAAQKLYEAGQITYHRTDSVYLSEDFIKNARIYIGKKFGKEYVPSDKNIYKTKSKSAQEAHEAIRPTDVNKDPASMIKLPEDQKKIYTLIWRSAIASQMAPAKLRQLSIDIYSSHDKKTIRTDPVGIWKASGSSVIFSGWMSAMGSTFKENLLPDLKENETLTLDSIEPTEHTTQAPPRYTEASLIKDLEKYGIGRPSTYAPTISTVQARQYVIKEDKYFFPHDTGIVVNDLLVKHFPDIVDLDFTAHMEDDLDDIADGKKEWVPVIREFFGPFNALLEKKNKEIKKEDIVVMEETDDLCPSCGGKLIIKLGKYGKFISCSNFPECKYAAPFLREGESADQAIHDEEQTHGPCPECKTGNLILRQGRFGAFIACSNYPQCKYTQPYMDKIGMICPECSKGDVVRKRTKRRKLFYGCSRYPECKYSSWSDPRAKREDKETGVTE